MGLVEFNFCPNFKLKKILMRLMMTINFEIFASLHFLIKTYICIFGHIKALVYLSTTLIILRITKFNDTLMIDDDEKVTKNY